MKSTLRRPFNLVLIVIVCCSSLLLLSACKPTSTCYYDVPDYPVGDVAADVDKTLATGEICDPPCWQGIVPGETSIKEALAILNEAPFVDNQSITRDSIYGFSDIERISWRSTLTEWDPYMPLNNFRVKVPDETIHLILITLEYELTVQELFDRFGEPERYAIIPSHPTCYGVTLIWLDRGFKADLYASEVKRNKPDQQLVTPEQLVWRVTYFPPVDTATQFMMTVYGQSADDASANGRDYGYWRGFTSVKVSTN